MAVCTLGTVVCRSATTCEIDTFMTVLSSTITNCAVPRMRMLVRCFIACGDGRRGRGGGHHPQRVMRAARAVREARAHGLPDRPGRAVVPAVRADLAVDLRRRARPRVRHLDRAVPRVLPAAVDDAELRAVL